MLPISTISTTPISMPTSMPTRLAAIFFPGVDFMGSLATALVVGVGGWLVLGDALTAGTLVAFVLYVERFFDPIRELAQRYNTFQATMAASERIFTLLDTAPDLDDAPDAIPLPPVERQCRFRPCLFLPTRTMNRSCAMSICMQRPASALPWSARPAPARARSFACWPASSM